MSIRLTRPEAISRISGKNTAPEMTLRRALSSHFLRSRNHNKVKGTRPDVMSVGSSVAVFVDGCFGHGCLEDYLRPRSREDFWPWKSRKGVIRDGRQTLSLEDFGWCVVRIWENELRIDPGRTADRAIPRLGGEAVRPHSEWRVIEVRPDQSCMEVFGIEDLRDPTARKRSLGETGIGPTDRGGRWGSVRITRSLQTPFSLG